MMHLYREDLLKFLILSFDRSFLNAERGHHYSEANQTWSCWQDEVAPTKQESYAKAQKRKATEDWLE